MIPMPSPGPSPDQIMAQIQALSGGDPSTAAESQAHSAAGTPPLAQPTPSSTPTSSEPLAQSGALAIHDVVQVSDPESPQRGVLFQVGALQGDAVHGYIIHENRRDYITVKLHQLTRIGEPAVRSRTQCSKAWLQEYGGQKL